MSSLNKTMLIGNLGRDPELRVMPDGRAVATFSVATTDKWKDRESGEAKEKTEWHRVVFYGGLAEVARDFAGKGRQVYVEGKQRTRKWTDQAGVERYTTEVVGQELILLGPKPEGSEQHGTPPRQPVPAGGDMDDDIPF